MPAHTPETARKLARRHMHRNREKVAQGLGRRAPIPYDGRA